MGSMPSMAGNGAGGAEPKNSEQKPGGIGTISGMPGLSRRAASSLLDSFSMGLV